MKLLTLSNTKTVKGEKLGYQTYIMHLAPSNLSGFNVCPMASNGCRSACLNTAGRGRFDRTQKARIAKTLRFFNERDAFMNDLVKDIQSAIRKSNKQNFIPVFRLNGTSDIRFETVPVTVNGIEYPNIMLAFPTVQFYDYTKLPNRRNLPGNYHLTFSRSESNESVVENVLQSNMNVAVVFNVKKGQPLPSSWYNRPVVDGDETDLRFLDGNGVVIGLRGKGQAKKDFSNFVVNV